MTIQKLLFPNPAICDEKEMFFRVKSGAGEVGADCVRAEKGATISLCTYFNAFSIEKWLHYTKLDNLQLRLFINGDVKIRAFNLRGILHNNEIKKIWADFDTVCDEALLAKKLTETLGSEEFPIETNIEKKDCGGVTEFVVDFPRLKRAGVFAVELFCESDVVLSAGQWETEVDAASLNPVKLAIGICTFKREKEATRNINSIKTAILQNPASPLFEKCEVYVSDNAGTLNGDFGCDKVHVFKNKNVGGAGGFTRTMIEALDNDADKNFSHIIFMDDDVLFFPEVFERTAALLQLVKDGYKNSFVGGTMFNADNKYLHYEKGAFFNGKSIVPQTGYIDARNENAVATIEADNLANYNGWWFCCMPTKVALRNRLPLPIFIHIDDVEYGLRNSSKNKLVLLNGIAVWHPSHRGKSPLCLHYYDLRNTLIVGVLTSFNFSFKQMRRNMSLTAFNTVLCFLTYQYDEAELRIEGTKAFLQGPRKFMRTDPIELHKKLSKFKFNAFSCEELGIDPEKISRKRFPKRRLGKILQMLCFLLPAKKETKVFLADKIDFPFRAKTVILYDRMGKRCLSNDRNVFRAIGLFFKWLSLFAYKPRYKKICAAWKSAKDELTSLEFWKKYLEI